MDAYRVWRNNVDNCYWTLGASEADAIQTVALTIGIEPDGLNAALDAKHDIPRGVVLDSDGKTTSVLGG